MNYYKVTIISTGSVYTQEGREILKDADIEITLGGVREEDLYHFISPESEKRYKGISAGDLKSIVLIDTPKSCRECYFQKGLTVYGYKGICPVCGKTNWICKSIAMELGVNTGIGHCLGCNTFLNVKFNEERQEMDLEIYEDYVKRTSEKEE